MLIIYHEYYLFCLAVIFLLQFHSFTNVRVNETEYIRMCKMMCYLFFFLFMPLLRTETVEFLTFACISNATRQFQIRGIFDGLRSTFQGTKKNFRTSFQLFEYPLLVQLCAAVNVENNQGRHVIKGIFCYCELCAKLHIKSL